MPARATIAAVRLNILVIHPPSCCCFHWRFRRAPPRAGTRQKPGATRSLSRIRPSSANDVRVVSHFHVRQRQTRSQSVVGSEEGVLPARRLGESSIAAEVAEPPALEEELTPPLLDHLCSDGRRIGARECRNSRRRMKGIDDPDRRL